MSQPSVLVIGAGMAGIVSATHLAQRGFAVTVLEKNPRPGGRCNQFQRQGHTFDTGPTLLVMPKLFEAEFASLGVSMWEVLDLLPVDPTYHIIFDDGSRLSLTADQARMRAQLEAIEPGSYAQYQRYMGEAGDHYDVAIRRLVNKDFRSLGEFFHPNMLPVFLQVHALSKHYGRMRGYFDEPRLKAAFTFQDVYMGLSPFEAPATFSMMSYTELAHGVYYPRGGMYSVVKVLMRLAQHAGVSFEFNTAVERILVEEDRAKGVRLANGAARLADIVLANADLPYVYDRLLPPNAYSRSLLSKRYSCSTLSFFWGVDKRYDMLPPHTLFLSDEYRENFETIRHTQDVPHDACLYVHAPARLDAAMAPAGQDTLIAILPIGHLQPEAQDWRLVRDQGRREVFRRLQLLGIRDLHEHIKFEVTYNPLSWRRRYNLVKGATHGLSHNLLQLGYFRPANRHPQIHNLYFAGASTHPGTGLPTVMVSARLAANRIADEINPASLDSYAIWSLK